MTLRELLDDIADRGKPGELAEPAWRRARRIRARRHLLTTATGVVAGLLVLAPLTVRLVSSSGPPAPPGFPAASPRSSSSTFPKQSPAAPSVLPGELPGHWVWGGGQDGRGGTLVFDRTRGALTELPYDWAIPAPTGDLVFVTNQDDWAGVLDLSTNTITPLQSPGTPFGPWSIGVPQWSSDGTRLLRADSSGGLYITDAVTGESRRIDLQGGCGECSSVTWLPGEAEVAIPVSDRQTDGLQVYSVESGAKLRQVPWYQARLQGFSPDGRYVVAKLQGRSGIVEVAGGRLVATIDADDTRTAYWAGPDVVLVVVHGGAVAYTLQGKRIQRYSWPAAFSGDELPNFTLVGRD